jgi:hypothetical protein
VQKEKLLKIINKNNRRTSKRKKNLGGKKKERLVPSKSGLMLN